MRLAIEELRQFLRDMPGAAAALLVAVVLGVGAHAAIFYEADGEELHLIANRSAVQVSDEIENVDPLTRMRARIHCPDKIPGFTLVVGLREYNVELSVPMAGFQSLFDGVRPEVATVTPQTNSQVAA